MRALHVLNTGKYSGAENVVITLIRALDGEIESAYASPDGPIRDILKEKGIKYFPVSTVAINIKELKQIIHQYRPDVIHAHDYNAGIMACLTGTNVPIINHLHNNTPWLSKICPRSLAYLASCIRYKKILMVSDSVMNEFIFGKLVKKKSLVVGNPVNVLEIREKAGEKGALHEASDVIFLGRLSEQKNPLFFLDIVADIIKKIPDLRVAMVGTGELRKEVEDKISKLKIEKNVKVYGFQKNPYALLNASKVVCMPSKWEGFGLAAVEGLALGKPVIASPVGGLQFIVNDQCGKICEEKEEYVRELERLLLDTLYYNSKSNEAKLRARRYANIESYSEKIVELYHTI